MQGRKAERVAGLVFGAARMASSLVPEGVKRTLEDRLFYAIFQLTRVTNDAYPSRKTTDESRREQP